MSDLDDQSQADEFDEAEKFPEPPPGGKQADGSVVWRVGKGRIIIAQLGKGRSMRLLVGIPVVYTALLLYVGLFVAVPFGWATVEAVKDLATVLAVPGTLAATIVGFFFGGRNGR